MPNASFTEISSRSLERTPRDSPESAACYVRRIQETDRTRKPKGSRDVISESGAFFQWAEEVGRLVPASYIEDRKLLGEILYRDEGAEHEVYHDEHGERAVKVTRPGMLILDYLDRLALSNHIFGDDVYILGLFWEKGFLRIVISQRWVAEDKEASDITPDDIDAYFAALMFEKRLRLDGHVEYYNSDVKFVASDAHAGNFIRSKGKLVPIDIIVDQIS